MDTYRLFGDSRSGNCYKAALMLTLTDRAYDWVETDVMKQETRRDEFLALNPNGKVPLLQLPDGRCLSESNAMLLYLSEGTQWLPDDRWQRALVHQWLFFEQYSHEPYIAVARFIVQLAGREVEEADRLKLLREKGYHALDVMERVLSAQSFMADEQFTIADIALYAYTHTAPDGGFSLSSYPAVRAWLERVEWQPGYLTMGEVCR